MFGRKPFVISIPAAGDIPQTAVWKELNWGDTPALHEFFGKVLATRQQELANADGVEIEALSADQRAAYKAEARAIFKLRAFPDIDVVLKRAARFAVPNILRLAQSEQDVGKGLLAGLHIALLWDKAGKNILGVATLQKTDHANEAEVTAWISPSTNRTLAKAAWNALMSWGTEKAGYTQFKMHIEAKTDTQRGNERARMAAVLMGFQQTAIRPADHPKGNGKDTLVMTKTL